MARMDLTDPTDPIAAAVGAPAGALNLKSYRKHSFFIGFLLLFHFIAGLLSFGRVLPERTHLFPIFSWSMFAWIEHGHPRYNLLIYEMEGHPLNPPKKLTGPQGICGFSNEGIAETVLEKIGSALKSQDGAQVEAAKKFLEKKFLKPPFRYEFIEEESDPLKLYRAEKQNAPS